MFWKVQKRKVHDLFLVKAILGLWSKINLVVISMVSLSEVLVKELVTAYGTNEFPKKFKISTVEINEKRTYKYNYLKHNV